MDKKWKKFERVVAAIHVAEAQGAKVTWDEDINGRQFDVVIRFKFQFYDYLVLIECKDLQRAVEVKEVDAFVTKSQDAKANKSIMVSSKGFQSGATEVAQRHNIELYTLTEVQEMPEDMFTDQVASVLIVWPLGFTKTVSNEFVYFSKEENKLRWEVNNIKLKGFGNISLAQLLEPITQLVAPFDIPGVPKFGNFPLATQQKQKWALQLTDGTRAVLPTTGQEISVSYLHVMYWMQSTRLMKPSLLDLTIFTDLGLKYYYKNVLTEDHTIVDGPSLPLGVDTKLESGKFYTQPGLKFFFYCTHTSATQAFLILVESYQHGNLVTAALEVPIPEANPYYLEVTDAKEIERLYLMYERYKS